jgi:hypothetical protein
MYYAPRLSPEKPGMPVLGYFTVVGCILLGLLFAADAYMPRHEQLSFVSHVDGLPASYKGEPKYVVAAAPHIAPAPAIAETTGSGFALAGEEPKRQPALAAQPTLTAQPVVQEAVKPAPRKVTRKRQQPDGDDFFGSRISACFASPRSARASRHGATRGRPARSSSASGPGAARSAARTVRAAATISGTSVRAFSSCTDLAAVVPALVAGIAALASLCA